MVSAPSAVWPVAIETWRGLKPGQRRLHIFVLALMPAFVIVYVAYGWVIDGSVNVGDVVRLARTVAFWASVNLLQLCTTIGAASQEAIRADQASRLEKMRLWLTSRPGASADQTELALPIGATAPVTIPHDRGVILQPGLIGVAAALMGVAIILTAAVHMDATLQPSYSRLWRYEYVLYGIILLTIGIGGVGVATSSSKRLFRWSEAQIAREAIARAELQKSELAVSQARMEPRLLFWALDRISALSTSNAVRAERIVERLSVVLRHALSRSRNATLTVEDELAFAREYLALEEERLEGKLRVTFDTDLRALPAPLLTRCLQPLLDDAIDLAMRTRPEGAQITIGTRAKGSRVQLFVEGDGIALPDGDGVRGLRAQLDRHYADGAKVEVLNELGRRRLTVMLPANQG